MSHVIFPSLLSLTEIANTSSPNRLRRNKQSQIRKPPIASSCLHAREPLAQRIKQEHTSYPANVNNPEWKPDSRRRRMREFVYRTFKLPDHRLSSHQSHKDRDQVRRVPLKQIEKQ